MNTDNPYGDIASPKTRYEISCEVYRGWKAHGVEVDPLKAMAEMAEAKIEYMEAKLKAFNATYWESLKYKD